MSRRTVGEGHAWARAAAVACALGALAAAPARDDGGGTYRVAGVVRVDAATPLGRELEARGDAIVRPGADGAVRLRLASMGQGCELAATRAADGALAFAAGQRCAFDLREADGGRGHVDARLRTGRGRLRDRHLSLDLAFDLAGSVALRTSEARQLLGVEIPAGWTPPMPVNGAGTLRAEGDRDESRAAER